MQRLDELDHIRRGALAQGLGNDPQVERALVARVAAERAFEAAPTSMRIPVALRNDQDGAIIGAAPFPPSTLRRPDSELFDGFGLVVGSMSTATCAPLRA